MSTDEFTTAAKAAFRGLFALGDDDPAFDEYIYIEGPRVGHVRVCIVSDPKCPPPAWSTKHPPPYGYRSIRNIITVDGCHAMGKTTLMKDLGGALTDLQEGRNGPLRALYGNTEEFFYFKSVDRANQFDKAIQFKDCAFADRSSWAASTVYSAFYRGWMFLYADNLAQQALSLSRQDKEHIVILDNPELSDKDLYDRMVSRGGIDKHQSLEYVQIVRKLFRVFAEHYALPIVSSKELEKLRNDVWLSLDVTDHLFKLSRRESIPTMYQAHREMFKHLPPHQKTNPLPKQEDSDSE